MKHWVSFPMNDLSIASGKSINPFEFPDEEFELYSVPSHETGQPEIVKGSDVGSNKQIVSPGSVLLCKINPRINRTWVVGKSGSRRQIASTEWIAFDSSEAIEERYLMYFMQQADFRDFLAANASGVGGSLMRIKPATLRGWTFRLPPRAEQTRIVEKLEALLGDLDAAVAELKAAQRKLASLRQSLLKAAVDGTLTEAWRSCPSPCPRSGEGEAGRGLRSSRKSTPPQPSPSPAAKGREQETGADLLQRILRERRARWETKQLAKFAAQGKTPPKGWQAKYPEPVAPDTTDLRQLPEGWVWASVEQLSEIQGGIQKQPSRAPVRNKFPFLRVANVARGQLKLDEIHEIELFEGEAERLLLEKGDVLIVEGNGSLTEIGRCAIWDGSIPNATHQNHLIRIRPIIAQGEFVETWLNSLRGIEHMTALAATTSGLYTLSVGKISKIPIPLPPLEEQHAIIEQLDAALTACDTQQAAIAHALQQAAAQRRNLLKTAFAGQLVPQDPADEPASELLARIRAAKADNVGTGSRKSKTVRRK